MTSSERLVLGPIVKNDTRSACELGTEGGWHRKGRGRCIEKAVENAPAKKASLVLKHLKEAKCIRDANSTMLDKCAFSP